MNRNTSSAPPAKLPAPPGWSALLLAVALLPRCAGKATPDATATRAATGGNGESAETGMATGGTGSVGGSVSAGGGVGGGIRIVLGGNGGASTLTGGAGADSGDTCEPALLFEAIIAGAVHHLGTCVAAPPPEPAERLGRLRGAVIIDSEGRVIDNTGLEGDEKQSWLQGLAGQRWVCMAGQVVGYKCTAAA